MHGGRCCGCAPAMVGNGRIGKGDAEASGRPAVRRRWRAWGNGYIRRVAVYEYTRAHETEHWLDSNAALVGFDAHVDPGARTWRSIHRCDCNECSTMRRSARIWYVRLLTIYVMVYCMKGHYKMTVDRTLSRMERSEMGGWDEGQGSNG